MTTLSSDRLLNRAMSEYRSVDPSRRPWLLRAKLGTYLIAADRAAFVAAAAGAQIQPRPVQLLVLLEMCLVLGGAGSLYRSPLTLSVLDDLPYLANAAVICLLTELSLKAIGLSGDRGTPSKCSFSSPSWLDPVLRRTHSSETLAGGASSDTAYWHSGLAT